MFLQVPVPWKPDINSILDTKYIPDEFASEPVHLTPQDGAPLRADDEAMPHFEAFSFHGSRSGTLGSYLAGNT